MEEVKYTPTKCNDCPFHRYNEWGPSDCALDVEREALQKQIDKSEEDKKLPRLCPLRDRIVTVQLQEHKQGVYDDVFK